MQVLNHLGALNLPDWWNAGKVAQDNSPIPFSESFAISLLAIDPHGLILQAHDPFSNHATHLLQGIREIMSLL